LILLGALIVNTLVLSTCSRLPTKQVGDVLVKLIGRGLSVVLRELAIALFQFMDAFLAPQPKMPRLNAA
jgi:hypothetical protein